MGVIVLFLSFFVFIFVGSPIALALGGSALIYIVLFANVSPLIVMQQILASVNTYTLLAVPFFIMAGALMETGGISKRIVSFCQALVGHFTGGLALVVVLASVFFAAMTGSGVAACAAVGGIMIPMMVKNGYHSDFACALQATSGIFGPLIPPSIVMVLYAVYANQSVSTMLMAGVGPGLMQAAMVCILAVWICHRRGYAGVGSFSMKRLLKEFGSSFWALLAPVIILGGIYSGVVTTTEVACVSVIYALIVSVFIYKTVEVRKIFWLVGESCRALAPLALMMAVATAFGRVLTILQIPTILAQFITSNFHSKVEILLIINVALLLIGMVMDTGPALLILVPMLIPLATELNIDVIHLGIIMVVNMAVGFVTPPFGVTLFVASPLCDTPPMRLGRKAVPFIITFLIALMFITFIPQISLCLL